MQDENKKDFENELQTRILNEIEAYRKHLEAQLKQLKWAVGVLVVILLGLYIFLSGRTTSDLQRYAREQVDKWVINMEVDDALKKQLDMRINKIAESDELKNEIKANVSQIVAQVVTDTTRKVVEKTIGEKINKTIEKEMSKINPTDFSKMILPSHVIIAWYPKSSDTKVPEGWAVCDGSQGTPDLREKFIMGTKSMQEVGKRGGAKSHSHRLHRSQIRKYGAAPQSNGVEFEIFKSTVVESSNLPPYFKMIYIMKL
ncbi:MAG: hypothetical protein GXO75_19395 [Calditrichaeota bacterium]|nr:hypothetical protein [Calditrichota bacterium]